MTTGIAAADQESLRKAFGSARVSPQRLELARCASAMDKAFTAEDLHGHARTLIPGLGVATTYRAIAAMAETGALATVGKRDGRALYAWCASHEEHHHHLVCTRCGRVQRTDCPLLAHDLSDTSNHGGFMVTHHELTLYGLCAACQAEEDR